MKKFVKGQLGRVISFALMFILCLPTLLAPWAMKSGRAEEDGRHEIFMLPLARTSNDVPDTVSSRMIQEMRLALVGQIGVQVNELSKKSPIFKRALQEASQADKTALTQAYDIAVDQSKTQQEREKAAADLANKMKAGTIVFGVIDNYEFTTKPHKVMIHVTVTRVTKTGATTIQAVGNSRVLPDGQGSQLTLENEAITNVAHELAGKLTNRYVPNNTPDKPQKPTASKNNNSWLYILIGGALLAALAGGAGGSGGGGSSLPQVDGISTGLGDSVLLQIPLSPGKTVQKIEVSRGSQSRARMSLYQTLNPADYSTQSFGGVTYAVWTDTNVDPSFTYSYAAKVFYADGATQSIRFVGAVSPGTIPAPLEVIVTQPSSIEAKLRVSWPVSNDPSVIGYYVYRSEGDTSRSRRIGSTISGPRSKLPVVANNGRGRDQERGRSRIGGSVRFVARALAAGDLIATIDSRFTHIYLDSDPMLTIGQFYRYEVVAFSASGESEPTASNQLQLLIAPENIDDNTFTATAEDGAVNLAWDAPGQFADGSTIELGATNGFRIYRKTTAPANPGGYTAAELTGVTPTIVDWDTTTYNDATATNRIRYYYIVVPFNYGIPAVGPYPYKSVIPQPPPAQLSLTAPSYTLVSAGPPKRLTVTVLDDSDAPLQLQDVELTCDNGSLSNSGSVTSGLQVMTVTTDANGRAYAWYYPPAAGSLTIVTVTAQLVDTFITDFKDFTLNPLVPDTMTFQLVDMDETTPITQLKSRDSLFDPGEHSTGILKATVYDTQSVPGHALPVSGAMVHITSSDATVGRFNGFDYQEFNGDIVSDYSDDSGVVMLGICATELITPTPIVFTAVAAGTTPLVSRTTNLSVVAGTPITPTISVEYAPIVSTITSGVVSVQDINGNPVPNASLLLSTSRGTIAPTIVTTNSDGMASFTLTMTPGEGDVTINAMLGVDQATLTVPYDIPANANPELITGSRTVALGSATAYTWLLKSAVGTPLANRNVRVTVNGGNFSPAHGVEFLGTTNGAGLISFTYNAPIFANDTTMIFYDQVTHLQIGDIVTITSQKSVTGFNPLVIDGPNRLFYDYATADDYGLNIPKETQVIFEGINGAGDEGAQVTISTDIGLLSFNGSLPEKSVTLLLDVNGKAVLTLTGDALLGRPTFTWRSMTDTAMVNSGITFTGLPSRMDISTMGTDTSTRPATLVQDQIMTVSVMVRDSAGQPVVSGFPLWFTQEWTELEDVDSRDTDIEYYNKAIGEGEVRGAYVLTGTDGKASAGFTSNHSGKYNVRAFVLNKNYLKAELDTVTNWDTAPQDIIAPRDLFDEGSVTAYTSVLNKTYSFGMNWRITRVTHATTGDSPWNARINCDGTTTSRITFLGKDEDGKYVLPGIAYQIKTDLGRIELDNGQSRTAGNWLPGVFNEQSEGYVISRGYVPADGLKAEVGQVHFTFNTMRSTFPNVETTDEYLNLQHYGPNFQIAGTFDPLRLDYQDILGFWHTVPSSVIKLAGNDQDNTEPWNKHRIFRLTLHDAGGQDYPNGYVVEAIINGVTTISRGVINNGEVIFDIGEPLHGMDIDHWSMQFRVLGPEWTGPGERIVPTSPIQIAITKPKIADIGIGGGTSLPLNSTMPVTARVFDDDGNPVINKFNIYFDIVPAPAPGGPSLSCGANPVLTDANGYPSGITLSTGNQPGRYRVRAYYLDPWFPTPVTLGYSDYLNIGRPNSVTPNPVDVPLYTTQSYALTLQSGGVDPAVGYPISMSLVDELGNVVTDFDTYGQLTGASTTVGSNGAVSFTYKSPTVFTPVVPRVRIIDMVSGDVTIGEVQLRIGQPTVTWTVAPESPKAGTNFTVTLQVRYGATPVKNWPVQIVSGTGNTQVNGAPPPPTTTDSSGQIVIIMNALTQGNEVLGAEYRKDDPATGPWILMQPQKAVTVAAP